MGDIGVKSRIGHAERSEPFVLLALQYRLPNNKKPKAKLKKSIFNNLWLTFAFFIAMMARKS